MSIIELFKVGLLVDTFQVIVMSATMDVDLFSEYFNKSPVLYLEGRQHPIQIYYTKQPQSDHLQAALISVFQIHQVIFQSLYSTGRKVTAVSNSGSQMFKFIKEIHARLSLVK